VNGHWYVGRDQCSSKKEAEQSAANNAWKRLVARESKSKSTRSFSHVLTEQPRLCSARVKRESIEHLPIEYADIERFIVNMVGIFGGRIKNIWTTGVLGRYKIEITGSYRYCDNIKKHHKKSQIYFLVDPIKKIYYQKCYHPTCLGFRSSKKKIIDEQELYTQKENNIVRKRRKCEKQVKHETPKRCKFGKKNSEKRVRKCNVCDNAIHCERCFDQHDS